ncbi:MAG TPA: penicillin-binding transpeptidase domain-containing protein [Candidatus Paceibacterota bacterium]
MRRSKLPAYLDPDEILLDASNLPDFDRNRLEGRIERSLSLRAIYIVSGLFILVALIYFFKLGQLQIVNAHKYKLRSEDNNLRTIFVQNERGAIYDRYNKLLAWNEPGKGRRYITEEGFGHLLGYLGYPEQGELSASLDPNTRVGKIGVEKYFNDTLRGNQGLKIEEMDVAGHIVSENIYQYPTDGQPITLAIDNKLQAVLYKYIKSVAIERGFNGGAGVLLDIENGDVLALTSYPEFSSNMLSGTTTDDELRTLLSDKRTPFLNRAISGLYAPGSIIKPIIAIGALTRNIIDPNTKIISTGYIEIPNPYSKWSVSIFKDWKAHGWVDMVQAIAVSSNVYFYEIGGGYKGQKGLGIRAIYEFARLFGLGVETGVDLPAEKEGIVPSPDWKEATFEGDPWRLGDTYHTAIGQYGFLVTPIQMARVLSAIASDANLITPHVLKDTKPKITALGLNGKNLAIIREGMRLAVTEGTAKALDVEYVKFGAKTGTAELGNTKRRVNSWIMGFFPYDKPRYAFAIVMEKGLAGNIIGAASVAKQFFDWMSVYTPEYFHYNGN